MSDGKRNIGVLTERVQTLQSELTQSQLRRSELEAELHNTQEVRSNRPKAGSRRMENTFSVVYSRGFS